jgi:hypothetical protein
MANLDTIDLVLAKLTGVFPSVKIGPDGMETYSELLEDIPDEALIKAMRACLLTCRFFPTIAELREKAEPIMLELHEKNNTLLIENAHALCPGNVWIDEKRNPHCKIEEKEPEQCKLAGTTQCGKWNLS